MTSPAIPGKLVAKQVSILKGGTAGVVPDIINEIHISLQHLSKFNIEPFTFGRSASLEVILTFHTSPNEGLPLSKESQYVDATICCLYTRSDVRHPGDPVSCDAEDEHSLPSAWDLSSMATVRVFYPELCWGRSVPLVLLLDKAELRHVYLDGISVSKNILNCTGRILPRVPQEMALQLTKRIDIFFKIPCLEDKK